MASIGPALAFMLPHEGAYSDVSGDAGGKTNFGITQITLDDLNRKHPEWELPKQVEDLTEEQAKIGYRAYWFFDNVESQRVASKVFDMGVNMGPNTAIRLLQEAILECGGLVTVDGKWGHQTLDAVNASDEMKLLDALCVKSASHYEAIVYKNNSQEKFLKGWLRRAKDLPKDGNL